MLAKELSRTGLSPSPESSCLLLRRLVAASMSSECAKLPSFVEHLHLAACQMPHAFSETCVLLLRASVGPPWTFKNILLDSRRCCLTGTPDREQVACECDSRRDSMGLYSLNTSNGTAYQ